LKSHVILWVVNQGINITKTTGAIWES
jgi:hypothetical protein